MIRLLENPLRDVCYEIEQVRDDSLTLADPLGNACSCEIRLVPASQE
jgi:hypothetical protein